MCLILPLALAFDGGTTFEILRRLPLAVRLLFRCWSAIPHLLASISYQVFRIHWLIIYALLPTLITVALWRARERDPEQLENWLDFAVQLILGLVVEFGRFEPASPAHLGASNRIILPDAGLYRFLVIRELRDVGFDLRPRLSDWRYGLLELFFYPPIAVPFRPALGFDVPLTALQASNFARPTKSNPPGGSPVAPPFVAC